MLSSKEKSQATSKTIDSEKLVRSPIVIWFFIAGCIAIGFAIGLMARNISLSKEIGNRVNPSATDMGKFAIELIKPSASLSPEQVVEIQVTALNVNFVGDFGLQQCFEFSSPANRVVTGPESRFFKMIRTEPYVRLMNASHISVGKSVVAEVKYATVLVSTVAVNSQCDLFRFYLSKQDESPFEECWMTDSVEWINGFSIPSQERNQDQEPAKGPSISAFKSEQMDFALLSRFAIISRVDKGL